MPLPADGILTLQGHSRPGDIVQSKVKKQAMIVRLSEEAFKLLETYPNQPPMEFEFGENPVRSPSFFSDRPLMVWSAGYLHR
jgi:RNA polymerase II elongation factor ELL